MEQANTADTPNPTPTDELPPGDHPLEIAARKGIGPLSPNAGGVWHGQTTPCVSCGQLVLRDAPSCDSCGQDLSARMIDKMKAHAGPWYVLEHVRPFPGVSLERIVRQIRRGVLGETSIVRGPVTDFQWRFAGETPGICRYFGKCWSCHEPVPPADATCPACGSVQAILVRRSDTAGASAGSMAPQATAAGTPVDPILALSAAVDRADGTAELVLRNRPPTVGGIPAGWLITLLLIVVGAAFVWFTQFRSAVTQPPATAPGLVMPTTDPPRSPTDDMP